VSFYQWGGQPAGSIADLITNSKLNANGYNWLTGLAGYEAPQTNAYYSGDGALTFQPTSNPAQINKTLQFKDYLGNPLAHIDSNGQIVTTASVGVSNQLTVSNLIVTGTASVGLFPAAGANMPTLVVNGVASIGALTTTVPGVASINNIFATGTATFAGRITAPAVGTSGKALLNYVPVPRQLTTYGNGSVATGFTMAVTSLPSWALAANIRVRTPNALASTTSLTLGMLDPPGNTMVQRIFTPLSNAAPSTVIPGDAQPEISGLITASGGCVNLYFSQTGTESPTTSVQVSLFGYYEPA